VEHKAVDVELLSTLAWDIRALGEAQVRSLTAMQRCLDDFRRTGDRKAAKGMLEHIAELETRSPLIFTGLRTIREKISQFTDA